MTIEQGVIRASLAGPDNPLRAAAKPLEIPFEVSAIDTAKKTCLLTIGRRKFELREREYSPWIRLDFKAGFGVAVRGIARFYVTAMTPDFNLYVTPINIDPGKPALPISWPRIYSIYLSKLLGEFATLGLAEDTWALNEGVIDEQAFLQQALDHHAERERMFFNALEKSRDGAVVCVFDGTDRLQHMFFRYLDSKHPANRGRDTVKFRDTILQMYQRADEMVGRVQRQLGPRDHFMVISDHGFQSFRRGINLNAWLHQNGLLHLDPTKPKGGDWFANVDWTRTKAYALGLSGLFINQRGREAHGIVEPGAETEAVKRQIIEGLTGLRDPEAEEAFDQRRVRSGESAFQRPLRRQRAGPDHRLQPRLPRVLGRRGRPRHRRSVHRQHEGLERRSLHRSAAGPWRAVLELADARGRTADPGSRADDSLDVRCRQARLT